MSDNCSFTAADLSVSVTVTLHVLLAVSLVVVVWAVIILLRCGRYLRYCTRLASGHCLAIDVGLSVTGLFTLNATTNRTTAEQVFYWLVILNWQAQLAMLLLVTVNVTKLLDFDHVVLIMIASWAFSSSPVTYLSATRDVIIPPCDRPFIWNPGLTTAKYLVIIIPMFLSQVLLLVLFIHSLLKRRRKFKGIASLVPASRICRDCETRHRSSNSLLLMWCLVAGFIAFSLPQSIWHSFLASLDPDTRSAENYPWAPFLWPGLSGLVDGTVVLTVASRFGLPAGINPCGRKNKQAHRDGGDYVHQNRGSRGEERCVCPQCRRHYCSVLGQSSTASPSTRRGSGDSGQLKPADCVGVESATEQL